MATANTIHDETIQHYSKVTKLIHYVSKFESHGNEQRLKLQRVSSVVDVTDRLIEGKRFRLAAIWPEWNETEINAESWDAFVTGGKRRELTAARARADAKTNISGTNVFDDPEGKVELPPSLKVEQWKRPSEFLTFEKPPVIVDSELGLQNFDLITSNEHLHYNQTMRNIISQIIALRDICRKTTNKPIDTTDEHTWRPWEHIYALNKVSKQPFITPYNPAGKYVVRLFFLGSWRKIIVDDTIPFDSNNQCLLPQTTLSYELWPMLLSKALLKILSLDFNVLDDVTEYNEASIVHSLTGWIAEPIPLKYTHTEKVWNFLRHDRSNRQVSENECYSRSSFGPIPLFKWREPKTDSPEESSVTNRSSICFSKQQSIDLQDDKSSKKGRTPIITKDPSVNKPISSKVNNIKDTKKTNATVREDSIPATTAFANQITVEAPKMIVFAMTSHLQPTRLSSFGEIADRSERSRRYNLNETFSTPILLTSIRDIPLEPPLPTEFVPAWKLIRPKKTKLLPHAEPTTLEESKPERWIEISSPYINYPSTNLLQIKKSMTRSHSLDRDATSVSRPSRLSRRRKSDMNGIDEEEDNKNNDMCDILTHFNPRDTPDKLDESMRSTGNKLKREISIDKTKLRRKSSVFSTKISLDVMSIKSKDNDADSTITPMDVNTTKDHIQQQILLKKFRLTPKIWMNFDDFCTCFTSIIVFHNPDGYQYMNKHTDIKFTPYQPPIATPVQKERKKELIQQVIPQIPNLQDDKSVMYLFVDSTHDTMDKNIELVISLTCLSRWHDAFFNDTIVSNDKTARGISISIEKPSTDSILSKSILSHKEIIPQAGSLLAEIYSWKSLSQGQPILRLHTTTTKGALLTLPPGRHVLKLISTCSFAYNLQILSDTNDFMLGDEDQLLNKLTSVPEDVECQIRAEEFFLALDDSIQNFHLIDQQTNKLHDFLRFHCQQAPASLQLTFSRCLQAFHQALYATLRTMINTSSSTIHADTQFAWRCYTNDLSTPDILAAYEPKRPTAPSAGRHSARTGGSSAISSTGKKTSMGKDKSLDEKSTVRQQLSLSHSLPLPEVQELSSNLLTRELSSNELQSVTNIQKTARGYLQRRIMLARTSGTEKNLLTQRLLQSTMTTLKLEPMKSASLLFKNLLSIEPRLVQCFEFRHDDWNMITYRDYSGIYQEQPVNTWFVLMREIFHTTTENVIVAKFLSHLPNSVLRVINNDTYEEMSLVFNRLAPQNFAKNKNGYTFFVEGISADQSIPNGRFRLRLITSYTQLPEMRTEQITSTFNTNEIMNYYIPNREQIICRYRVIVADDINQTGRGFHLASLRFQTSKSDVLMRLTISDNNEELLRVEGKGCLVIPAILFMRNVTNTVLQPLPLPPPPIQQPASTRSISKTGGGARKKDGNRTTLGDTTPLNNVNRSDKDTIRPSSRSEVTNIEIEEKFHKYIIQVTLLYKSWPLTPTQWQFVEQLKDQEKKELKPSNRQQTPTKTDRSPSTSATTKRTTSHGNTNTSSSTTTKGRNSSTGTKGNTSTASTRPSTAKGSTEKTIDKNKPHWILQIVSDADKADEITIKKDTERHDELMNIKKAWETLQVGRAEKAMRSRQKFLESIHVKVDDHPSSQISDNSETVIDNRTISSPIIEQPEMVRQPSTMKKSSSSLSKKTSVKDDLLKQTELIPTVLPQVKSPIDEPLLNESPSKPKLTLPLLDVKPFLKQKLLSERPVLFDTLFEQEDMERRQKTFIEYSKRLNDIRVEQKDDKKTRYKEKLRQLDEYLNLQAKIDQTRRTTDEAREAFRQRFLEKERKRLEELILQEQKLTIKSKATIATGTTKKKN